MAGSVQNPMYALRPVFKLDERIVLPKNMYKMRKIDAVGEAVPPSTDVLSNIQDKSDGDMSSIEKMWDVVLEQLRDLQVQLADIKKSVQIHVKASNKIESSQKTLGPNQLHVLDGAVLNANPDRPPYSLLLLRQLYKDNVRINFSCHAHSTIPTPCVEATGKFTSNSTAANGVPQINLFLIWKTGLLDTQLVMNPWKQSTILGEVNILRYLARLGLTTLEYDDNELSNLSIDSLLDTCHRLLHVRTAKEKTSITRNLNAKLGKSTFFGGNEINISDIAVWSALNQVELTTEKDLSQNLVKWFARVNDMV